MDELTIENLIRQLDENTSLEKTAEENFAEGLAYDEGKSSNKDLVKVAEEMDQMGRIMARSFINELEKQAIGSEVNVTDPDAVAKINPAAELSQTPLMEKEPDVASVVARINQMRAATQVGASKVESKPGPGGELVGAHRTPPTGAPPIEYDSYKASIGSGGVAKTAADRIIGTIYNLYFGE